MCQPRFFVDPYKWEGVWVFDDPYRKLVKEPFIDGADVLIDRLLYDLYGSDISDADQGFRLWFSNEPFGEGKTLTWVREQDEGNVYVSEDGYEAWLCPALYEYFSETPKKLYVRADERKLP